MTDIDDIQDLDPRIGWNVVDLHLVDEDELAALVDDACDNDKTFVFTDSDDLDQANKPLAVLLPYAKYEAMQKAAHGIIPEH